MNKYQEAIDRVARYCSDYRTYIMPPRFELTNELSVLMELVEKATPKKAYCIHVEYSYCPNCHNSMSYDYNDKPMYCRNCGQALDWSDEE